MNKENDPNETSSTSRDDTEDVRRNFNPMVSWILLCGAIAVSYGLLWLGGYPLLTTFMVIILVWHGFNSMTVLDTLKGNFQRKATYFNVIHAGFWFAFLAINSYWISQFAGPLLIPQLPNLTELSPLWILMSVFGTLNLREMYEPGNPEKVRYSDYI
ncbi:MAG: hypothetical protein GF411_20590 [Candidatus Lokiarchaeota archaeon]|nr:hypothetical protein [Candidatus Lokiarchaeota archaeon]